MRTIKSDKEFDILLACKQPVGNFIRIHYGLSPPLKTGETERDSEYFKRLMSFNASMSIGKFINED